MILRYKPKYLFIQFVIWVTLPITIIKQRLFPLKGKVEGFPDFLVIGAQKAGTTWLYANLKQHKDLFLSEKKEIHYFDWNFYRSIKWYLSHFKKSGDKIRGEVTPAYSTLDRVKIKHIYRCNPHLKIIFIVRNPIERAWSHALNNYCVGMNIPFEKLTTDDFNWHFNSYASTIRSDYSRTVSNWLSVFPKEQFYLCYYEDVKENPEQLLNNVFGFLGVNSISDFNDFPFNKVINRGPTNKIPEKESKLLEELYYPKIKQMVPYLGERCLKWIKS